MTRNGSNEAFSNSTFSIAPDFPIRDAPPLRAHNHRADCIVYYTVTRCILCMPPIFLHAAQPAPPDVSGEFLPPARVARLPGVDRQKSSPQTTLLPYRAIRSHPPPGPYPLLVPGN